jgi:hypothetical protein
MAGCKEHGNTPSGFVKAGNSLSAEHVYIPKQILFHGALFRDLHLTEEIVCAVLLMQCVNV